MSHIYEAFNDKYGYFPFKIYKHNLSGTSIYSPLHWHRSIEITILLEGNMRFNLGRNNFDFAKSSWLFVNSCELHSCSHILPTDTFKGISIIISPTFVEKILGTNLLFVPNEDNEVITEIQAIAKNIYLLSEQDALYQLQLYQYITQLLVFLAEHCRCETAHSNLLSDTDIRLLETFTEYIEQHYSEALSLDEIASHFLYSPAYFSKLFKDIAGVTFHKYLGYVRTYHAAADLSSGRKNITACALDNGFPNIKSFSQAVKEIYGCQPKDLTSL